MYVILLPTTSVDKQKFLTVDVRMNICFVIWNGKSSEINGPRLEIYILQPQNLSLGKNESLYIDIVRHSQTGLNEED